MMTQVLTPGCTDEGDGRGSDDVDHPVCHLVTLINRLTGHERSLKVHTQTDAFTDVIREVCQLKVMHKLQGYEVYETVQVSVPF